MKPDWRNRIVGEGTRKASQFHANPLNYRTHPQSQREAVRGSLDELGWIQRVIVNRTTGNLIDGHERVWQALHADDAEVPYVEVELSEAEEKLALAVLDPLSAMAETDAKILDDLLRDVSTGNAALQELLAGLGEEIGIIAETELPTRLGNKDEHSVVVRYTTDDAEALRRFVGGPIDDNRLGKRILERIKKTVETAADYE